jgi:hypothetical protein
LRPRGSTLRRLARWGEDLVRRLEEFRGVSVVERKTLGSYDFYTYDPSESNQPEGRGRVRGILR